METTSTKADLTSATYSELVRLAEQEGMAASTLVRRTAERVASLGVPENLPTGDFYLTQQVRCLLTASDLNALHRAPSWSGTLTTRSLGRRRARKPARLPTAFPRRGTSGVTWGATECLSAFCGAT